MAINFPREFTTRDTLWIVCRWKLPGGVPFPWAEFSPYTYRIAGQSGGVCLTLTDGDGIEIDPDQGAIQFLPPADFHLCAGIYTHGCTIHHIETGQDIQFFTGSLVIIEAP